MRFNWFFRFVQYEVDSVVIIPIYLAVYCKVRIVNFISFTSESPVKARVAFELYLGVRCHLKKKTDNSSITRRTFTLSIDALPHICCLLVDCSLKFAALGGYQYRYI